VRRNGTPSQGIVEPAVPAILREPRTPEIPEPLDLSPVDDAEDVDLVHHPSYQERGLPNTPNNRRRRRRRLDEPVAKEESQTTKVISRPTPILSGKSEPAAESELLDLGERTVKTAAHQSP
jgi:ribonuclease E